MVKSNTNPLLSIVWAHLNQDFPLSSQMDIQELVEELFPDLFDVNGHSDLFTFDMETSFIDSSMSSWKCAECCDIQEV